MDGTQSIAAALLGGEVSAGPSAPAQAGSIASRILGDFSKPDPGPELPSDTGRQVAPPPAATEIAKELPSLLLGQGIDPSDKEALFTLAKSLSGSLTSMSQLATLLTSVVMGAQRSREPTETVGEINSYMNISRALGGI